MCMTASRRLGSPPSSKLSECLERYNAVLGFWIRGRVESGKTAELEFGATVSRLFSLERSRASSRPSECLEPDPFDLAQDN
jgi:hypothetical protein